MSVPSRLDRYIETEKQRHFPRDFMVGWEAYETWEEATVGQSGPAQRTFKISEEDILDYNRACGETDPLMVDPDYARKNSPTGELLQHPGEVGEIHIGGATIIREYYNNPEATAEARKGGFFTLGDMGRFDEEGYLYIVDRKKDMIISGGENIFPNDIEEVLYRHAAVEMAAVVGAPDPKWGEIVVAVVTLKPGGCVGETELIAHCKTFLSGFNVPKRIDFRDQMPMSSFGKILRRDVRKSYWEHLEVKV